MRNANSWLRSVVVLLAGLSAVGAAQAQSESKTWYVPWAWSPRASADTGSISVTNLNGEAVRVNVRAFNAQGAALSASSSAFSLSPAASSSVAFPVDPRGSVAAAPAFVLVLSDQPVLVRARAVVLLRPSVDVEADCQRISSRGEPNGVLFLRRPTGQIRCRGQVPARQPQALEIRDPPGVARVPDRLCRQCPDTFRLFQARCATASRRGRCRRATGRRSGKRSER